MVHAHLKLKPERAPTDSGAHGAEVFLRVSVLLDNPPHVAPQITAYLKRESDTNHRQLNLEKPAKARFRRDFATMGTLMHGAERTKRHRVLFKHLLLARTQQSHTAELRPAFVTKILLCRLEVRVNRKFKWRAVLTEKTADSLVHLRPRNVHLNPLS